MQIAKKVIEGSTLKFVWADESETEVVLEGFGEDILQRATLHGLSQKLGDSYSGAAGDVGKAKAMLIETLDALRAGDWNRKGGGFSSGGIWVEALAKAAGEDMDRALAAWNELA